MENLQTLSDKDLYARCQEYGTNARVWRRRFAGLLPEVLRRDLHRRRGFSSIYEFAFKMAGMSSASVDKVLHLAEKLEDKPALREQLVSGAQGWSKIEKVAFIATPETDKEWAEKVETMGTYALEAFVQEKRKKISENSTKDGDVLGQTHMSEPTNKFRMEQWGSMSFPVSPEVEKRMRLLKYQLEKERGQTLTFNEMMEALMKGGIRQEAQVVIQVCPECAARKAADANNRSIPAIVKRLLNATYHGYCAFPTCDRPGSSLHHTKRYSLSRKHDPKSIVPLCKAHERLVHCGFIENEEDPPEKWRLLDRPDQRNLKNEIDKQVFLYRKELI